MDIKKGAPSRYRYARDARNRPQKEAGAKGYNGTVFVDPSEKWSRWEREVVNDTEYWRRKDAYVPSLARKLAHELGHAARGCDGSFIFSSAPGFKNFRDIDYHEYDGVKIENYHNLKSGERLRETTPSAKATWGNVEEYETTMEWENPIAEEMGEGPRLGHQ